MDVVVDGLQNSAQVCSTLLVQCAAVSRHFPTYPREVKTHETLGGLNKGAFVLSRPCGGVIC
jgi:hypothetical protein